MIFADKNSIQIIKGKDTLTITKDECNMILQLERSSTDQVEKRETNILLTKNEQDILKNFLEK